MATSISSNSKAALSSVCGIIVERLYAAIAFQSQVDQGKALAGIYSQPNGGLVNFTSAAADYRSRLAEIKEDGRRMLDGVLAQMGYECGSKAVNGSDITDYPRLFRNISADLLGGTPDYVTARGLKLASNPAAAAAGIFRRLSVDHLGEQISDGWHGGTKTVRITSKPARYYSNAVIEGPPNTYADDLAYRAGRTRVLNGYVAVNDAQQPTGILNPYLTPSDLTDAAAVTSIANWTIATSGSYTMVVDTAVMWRGRTYSLMFSGANASYFEIEQVIPSSVFSNPFNPWDLGVPVRLTTGWQGTITITWGSKSQSFTHADLTNGSFKHLFLDLDKDLFPVNFDSAGAKWKIRFTNDQLNTDSIYIGGFIPQAMLNFEGHWFSHFSDESEPVSEETKTWADSMVPTGDINDALSFVYHDLAPGWAHLPSSGTATIADTTYAPEIQLYNAGTAVASGGSIALGSVASGAHVVNVTVTNSGTGALAVNTPTAGTNTNITSVTFGQTTPIVIQPGESYTLVVTVTDAGAGAFSTTVTMLNNDASEGTTTVVISGTAT